jgi:hypothetical protein
MEETRNVAYARVWTGDTKPVEVVTLCDALADRGFIPGVTDAQSVHTPTSETGWGDYALTLGGDALRFVSLSSSRGNGATVRLVPIAEEPMPDDRILQRAVRHPQMVYLIEAGGPSNSDRNLCENLAEALMLATHGGVEIGGRGVKGNKPVRYTRCWLGQVKADH